MKQILSLLLLLPCALNAGPSQSKIQPEETTLPNQFELKISVDVFKKDLANHDKKIARGYTTYKINGHSFISASDSEYEGSEYRVQNIKLESASRALKTASIKYDLITPKNTLPRSKFVTIGESETDHPMSNEVYLIVAASIISSK